MLETATFLFLLLIRRLAQKTHTKRKKGSQIYRQFKSAFLAFCASLAALPYFLTSRNAKLSSYKHFPHTHPITSKELKFLACKLSNRHKAHST